MFYNVFFFGNTLIYVLIHSIVFYERLTMNIYIKRPNPIQKVISTKQLIKPSKREGQKK